MKQNNTLSYMAAQGSPRAKTHATNQWSGHANDGRDVQMPQMPVKRGNPGKMAGPATAHGGHSLAHRDFKPSAGQNYTGNADKIAMPQMPNRKGNGCC